MVALDLKLAGDCCVWWVGGELFLFFHFASGWRLFFCEEDVVTCMENSR